MSILLDSKANVNQKDSHGDTALIGASAVRFDTRRGPEVLRILLAKGAPVDATNALAESALMWAVKSGNPGAIEILLKAGANARKTDEAGHDAMFYLRNGPQRPDIRPLASQPV